MILLEKRSVCNRAIRNRTSPDKGRESGGG